MFKSMKISLELNETSHVLDNLEKAMSTSRLRQTRIIADYQGIMRDYPRKWLVLGSDKSRLGVTWSWTTHQDEINKCDKSQERLEWVSVDRQLLSMNRMRHILSYSIDLSIFKTK